MNVTLRSKCMVDSAFLAQMPATSVLINVSRGPIVDELALIQALRNNEIAGAALDVFESEPLAPEHPFLALDNVTLTPHCVAWTNEMSWGNGLSATTAILESLAGIAPRFVVNSEVLERES